MAQRKYSLPISIGMVLPPILGYYRAVLPGIGPFTYHCARLLMSSRNDSDFDCLRAPVYTFSFIWQQISYKWVKSPSLPAIAAYVVTFTQDGCQARIQNRHNEPVHIPVPPPPLDWAMPYGAGKLPPIAYLELSWFANELGESIA